MFRRTLLLGSTVVLSIGSCTTFNSNVSQAADDLSSIAAGFAGALSAGGLSGLGIPADMIAQIGVWVSQLQTAAQSVKSAMTVSGAQDGVKQAEVLINAIVATLAKFPLPPPIPAVLTAATILLPVIETALGMIIQPAPQMGKNVSVPMTNAEARLTLKAVVSKR
jgi:hypothetical protein